MNHRPAPPKQRPARHGAPRTRRTLTVLGGLAGFLAAASGLAPAAWATLPPPEPSTTPVAPPPPAPAPAHFPLWAIVAMVAATIVLALATTLITLAVEHLRRSRRTPAAAAGSQASRPAPAATPQSEAGQGEILASHHHAAGHDSYRAGRP
jgi:hypothetical protein